MVVGPLRVAHEFPLLLYVVQEELDLIILLFASGRNDPLGGNPVLFPVGAQGFRLPPPFVRQVSSAHRETDIGDVWIVTRQVCSHRSQPPKMTLDSHRTNVLR